MNRQIILAALNSVELLVNQESRESIRQSVQDDEDLAGDLVQSSDNRALFHVVARGQWPAFEREDLELLRQQIVAIKPGK